jgi:hypothetical protein
VIQIQIRTLQGKCRRIKTSRRPIVQVPRQPSYYPFFSVMRIDYRICDKWADSYVNLSRAGKTELRYDVGLGDVILRFDQIHLSAKGGWIPLIDFALALDDIANRPVKEEGPATLEFAELDAILCFDRKGSNLVISVNYIPGQIEVPLVVFREQVERFEASLRKELQERYPALARNQTFQELFAVGNG